MVIPVKSTPIADDRSASSVRVLVVEDFEPFQRVIRSMLQGRPELQANMILAAGITARSIARPQPPRQSARDAPKSAIHSIRPQFSQIPTQAYFFSTLS